MNVVILGASGLVGNETLGLLLDSDEIAKVRAIGRTRLSISHPKLEQVVMELDDLQEASFRDAESDVVDVLILALGASFQSGGNYKKVDLDYGINAARIANKIKVKQIVAVSSALSHRYSPSTYLRVKAGFEARITALNFTSILLVKPGPLLGRLNTRPQEELLLPLFKFMAWISGGENSPISAISGKQIAKNIVYYIKNMPEGVTKLSSRDMLNLS